VYSAVSKALPVDFFSYGTFSKTSQLFVPVFEVSERKQHYHTQGLKGKSVVLTPDSVLWDVAAHGRSYVGDAAAPFPERGSLMIVAVRSKKEVIGFLSLVHFTPRSYSDTHLRLLESIATLTEIAVDKATLYEEAIEKSAEIQRRNKELDDFTYVVSHDLKEPLISVEGYTKILLEDYKERIGKEGAEYLSSIIQSGARMKSLINDLLTLSRVGRSTEQLSLVSCSDVIREILLDLHFMLDEKNVSVEIPDHLPDVRYNRTHLHMVIANLVSNAVKFNNKPNPRIILRVAEEENRYVFSVTDNGIGIDERYFDKIFIIFQRLEQTEGVPGTGAGLSIVKKIVEGHNGRVWVDSKLGEGTTMNFSIPK
jgi:light-regulated signal transduction histidine kinase (bacteriophytochrome)